MSFPYRPIPLLNANNCIAYSVLRSCTEVIPNAPVCQSRRSPYSVLWAEVRGGFYREGAKDAKKTSETLRSLCLGGEKWAQVCLATLDRETTDHPKAKNAGDTLLTDDEILNRQHPQAIITGHRWHLARCPMLRAVMTWTPLTTR